MLKHYYFFNITHKLEVNRNMYNYCAVIPSLNPDRRLESIVKKLLDKGFLHIILVNDGSDSDEIFKDIQQNYGCDLLTHCVNLGKGRAMKTAMNYYMNTYADQCEGIVFVDGDDQHDIDDVCKCCQSLTQNPDSLILGARDFNSENIPPKSRYGNKITSRFFRLFCGLKISDTQTGLRVIPNKLIPQFIGISGERFDYETNMLLETKRLAIPIVEVPIRTIYENDNKQSHFNPIKDSIAIYKMLLGFVSSSLASAVIDLGLYQLLFILSKALPMNIRILLSTAIARLASSLFNYTVNSKLVFQCYEDPKRTIVKYYLLCIVQAAASYGGVFGLSFIFGEKSLIAKLIVDTLLSLISFKIQQNFIFKNKPRQHSGGTEK